MSELDRHFHRCFDGGGSVVTKEDTGEGGGREERDQAICQGDGLGIRRAEERDVGNAFELFTNGAGDCGVAMTVDIRPDRGVSIEVSAALAIVKPSAFTTDEHEGLVVLCAPIGHGCEGVPEALLVKLHKGGGIPNISHEVGI